MLTYSKVKEMELKMNAKKIIAVALLLTLAASLASCVNGPANNTNTGDAPPALVTGTSDTKPITFADVDIDSLDIDLSAVVSHISSNITFDEVPVEVMDNEIAEINYDIAGLYSEMYVVSSSLATAECIGYFKASDKDSASSIANKLAAYCSDMSVVFSSYNAEAADKLSKALIETKGNYVLMCVSPDSDAVKEVYRNFIVALAEGQK